MADSPNVTVNQSIVHRENEEKERSASGFSLGSIDKNIQSEKELIRSD